MTTLEDCRKLQNAPLLAVTRRLARAGDAILADLLAHLAEVNRRELHLEEGFRSLFAYCMNGLGFTEGETHNRVYTARAAARFPAILPMIREGRLRMSSAVRLAKHLTPDNHMALLEEACGKTIAEIEVMVARLAPRPDRPDVVRRVCAPVQAAPEPTPGSEPSPATQPQTIAVPEPRPAARQRVTPLAPQRVHISFTASAATADKIKQARERLRRRFPEGRLEDLVEAAFEALLEREDPGREPSRRRTSPTAGASPTTRPVEGPATRPVANPAEGRARKSRGVPAAVRREVWRRDGGRCSYAAPSGRRCDARERLEFDHIVPWSVGGSSDAQNVRLLCRAHNLKRARARFGTDMVPRRE